MTTHTLIGLGVVGLFAFLAAVTAFSARRAAIRVGEGDDGDEVTERLATIERRLDGLKSDVDDSAGASRDAAVRLENLAEGLDELAARTDDDVVERIGDRLDGVERKIDAASGTSGTADGDVVERIDDRLDAIEQRVDEVGRTGSSADGDVVETLERVEQRLTEVDADRSKLEKLDKLDRLDETERVGAGVDRANLGVSPDDISDEFDSLAAKMDDIEGRVVTIQEGLSNVADSQTVTQPLTSIEDRLRQIDGRLNELREGVSADEDSSVKELLGALDSEISAIEQRLGDIESQIEGEGGIGSIDFAGTASTDSDTSGFIDDDSSDIDELDDVDEEFDFDEAFLGVEDEEDAV